MDFTFFLARIFRLLFLLLFSLYKKGHPPLNAETQSRRGAPREAKILLVFSAYLCASVPQR
jgi:hypothetical protein